MPVPKVILFAHMVCWFHTWTDLLRSTLGFAAMIAARRVVGAHGEETAGGCGFWRAERGA